MIDGNDSNDWVRGWEKKLKGPGHKANLSGRSQFTCAPEESAEHDDCRQQEWMA